MPRLGEELAQRRELRRIGRVVDAVHAGLPQPLQRLGRGDIGGDHELLDQPVAVEPLARLDAGDPAGRIEQDAPLGQIELERAAPPPRPVERAEGAIERPQHRLEERPRRVAGAAVDRRLRLLVGEPRGRAHQPAHEAVAMDAGRRASIQRCTAMQARSTPGFSEHSSFDSASGSIGTTRSGK